MTKEERAQFLETFGEIHERAMHQFAEHLVKNFRGEIDVVSGKLDRLRERVEQLEKAAIENAPTAIEGRR